MNNYYQQRAEGFQQAQAQEPQVMSEVEMRKQARNAELDALLQSAPTHVKGQKISEENLEVIKYFSPELASMITPKYPVKW